jgi:hypothetical protein
MFEYQKIKTKLGDWNIIKVNLDPKSDLISRAVRQAKQKIKHTMQAGQDGATRSSKLKLQNQFRGMIAEIYAVELFKTWLANSEFNNCEVIRYDDVRTDDFVSPENEYDIKIQKNGQEVTMLKIESRSSLTYNRSLIEGINDLDIIGPYISQTKTRENYVDYYIRPLYDNKDEMKTEDFSEFLKKDLIDLYFVAGCSKQTMIDKGKQKSMSQSGTTYKCLPITQGSNILQFRKELIADLTKKQK